MWSRQLEVQISAYSFLTATRMMPGEADDEMLQGPLVSCCFGSHSFDARIGFLKASQWLWERSNSGASKIPIFCMISDASTSIPYRVLRRGMIQTSHLFDTPTPWFPGPQPSNDISWAQAYSNSCWPCSWQPMETSWCADWRRGMIQFCGDLMWWKMICIIMI